MAEAAFQHALAYARERKQGKAASYKGEGMAPIIHHPDLQRMLMTMKSQVEAIRARSEPIRPEPTIASPICSRFLIG